MKKISFVILAAGKSRRMKSLKSKVLHELGDKVLLDYVWDIAYKNYTSDIFFVCSPQVKNYVKKNYKKAKSVIQKKQLGTAHAVECTKKYISKNNHSVVILFGDVPLIRNSTIKKLIKYNKKSKSIGTIVTFRSKNPYGYGRIILENQYVKSVIEEKDANYEQKKINLCNSGILICDSKYLFETIKKISNKNSQKERFLTDICRIAYNEKKPFSYINCDEAEVLGVNSQQQLITLEEKFQDIYKSKLINNGVKLIRPDTITISHDTKIARNVVIEPNTIIKSGVKIADSTKILGGSYLENCKIGKKCRVGPYARIRPNTILNDCVKVGNYVEIKNSKIGKFSSIAHLSYIGDAEIGNNVNIGAGTITCNYDGIKKNKTKIEKNVFIGSNCSLIAPLKINQNSIIGAGSVVDKDVPSNSLALERSKLLLKKRKFNKNKGK